MQVLWITLCILTNGTGINDFAPARLWTVPKHFRESRNSLKNRQKFSMVRSLNDHRNDVNIFKTLQCSTCVWNILMLHEFLWLTRVHTMENCCWYVFDVYFRRSFSQNWMQEKEKTNCATVMSFPWSVHSYQALLSTKQHARNRSVMVKTHFDLGYGQVHCTMAKYDWQERKAMLCWNSNLSLHIKVRASFLPSLLG